MSRRNSSGRRPWRRRTIGRGRQVVVEILESRFLLTAPVAADDAYETEYGSSAIVQDSANGVLANDVDPDGDTLTAVLSSDASHGALQLASDGSFTYEADFNFFGVDEFQYVASDGQSASEPATVTIRVPGQLDVDAYLVAPHTDFGSQPTGEFDRQSLTVFVDPADAKWVAWNMFPDVRSTTPSRGDERLLGALTTGVDDHFSLQVTNPLGQSMSATLDRNQGLGAPQGPQAVIYGDAEDAPDVLRSNNQRSPYVFDEAGTHNSIFTVAGEYRFDFAFQNIGGLASYPDVWLLVNQPFRTSQAVDDSYSVDEDGVLSVPAAEGVLSNDTHESGLPLTAELVADVDHGELILNADGSFTYAPDANFFGIDQFRYRASDGQSSSVVAVATISVAPIADAPVAVEDSYSLLEDSILQVVHVGKPTIGLVNHWPFDETSGGVAQDVVGGNHGTLYRWGDSENKWVGGKIGGALDFDSNDDYLLTQTGVVYDRFTVAFWMKVEGGGGFNPRIVTARDSEWVYYWQNNAQGVGSYGPRIPNRPVLDQWDHYAVTFEQISKMAAVYKNGILVVEGPNNIAVGIEPILMGHSQDLGSHVDSLNGVLDDVRIYSRQLQPSEVAAFSSPNGVLANDQSDQGGPLTATLFQDVQHGALTWHADGTFEYVPDAEFSGIDSFLYQSQSGEFVSEPARVTLVVETVNDAPMAGADNFSLVEDAELEVSPAEGVLANDSDAEGAVLAAVLVQNASHGSLQLEGDGSFSYRPHPDFFGADQFTYRAHDGDQFSDPVAVTITVAPQPDAPRASDDFYSIAEDETLDTSNLGGEPFTETLVPASSFWKFLDDGSNQLTAWREPAFDDSSWEAGPSELGYGDGDEATVVGYGGDANNKFPTTYFRQSFSVEDVDRIHELTMNLKWDDAIAVYLNGVEVLRENLAPNASYDAYANGTVSDETQYQQRTIPRELLAEGLNVLAAEVHQASRSSSDISFDLRMFATRLTPAGVLSNDFDGDGDELIATLISGPSSGNLTLNEDGSFQYAPNANFFGEDSFTYRVDDGAGLTDMATVSIQVNEVNDRPQAVSDEYLLIDNQAITVAAESGVLANDSDQDGHTLTARVVDQPNLGVLILNPDGSFQYTPGDAFTTSDAFVYVANDGTQDSELAAVTILADIPRIDVGNHLVSPNSPNQIIDLIVTGSQEITGVNIRAQIGDGIGPESEPVFQAVDFTGGIWDEAAITTGGGPVSGAEQFVQANAQFTAAGTTTTAEGRLVRLIVDTTGFSEGTFQLLLKDTEIGADTDFVGAAAHIVNGTITIANSRVVGRHIFYNDSYFDRNNPQIDSFDDLAIATDKTALLPGETAAFANYTSYFGGITGIMVDVAGAPGAPGAKDFQFKVGNDNAPANWEPAPAPTSVAVREGAGVDGWDRVTIVWPGKTIQKQWLQVTVLATGNTGLPAPDVFYFGNAVGDAGDSADVVFVDGTDFALARDNPRNFLNRAPIDFPYDYNRDSFVDGFDLAIARDNGTNFLTALKLITAPRSQQPAGIGFALFEPALVDEQAAVDDEAAEMEIDRRFGAIDFVLGRELLPIKLVRGAVDGNEHARESAEELLTLLAADLLRILSQG